jgi:hypothetical protein
MSGDLFGYTPEPEPFTDIRNQRDSVAEEKAVLCMQLSELCRKVPPSICSASAEKTRAFMHARERAKKVLMGKRSSRTELAEAIKNLRSYA